MYSVTCRNSLLTLDLFGKVFYSVQGSGGTIQHNTIKSFITRQGREIESEARVVILEGIKEKLRAKNQKIDRRECGLPTPCNGQC